MSSQHLVGSVGLGGVNREADRSEVRFLLDMHLFSNTRLRGACAAEGLLDATGSLIDDPDPIAAAMTGSAIVQFQKIVMRWSRCDGLVEPRGLTWGGLTGSKGPGNAAPIDVTPALPTIGAALGNAGFKAFNQGAYSSTAMGYRWDSNKDKKVDETDAYATISQQGCLLCSLTMAATGIGRPTSAWPTGVLPRDLTPIHVNTIAKNNRCYFSGGLDSKELSPLLGMTIKRYGPGYEHTIPANPVDQIDGHFGAGGVVVAHVDYKNNSKHSHNSDGDHWILITNTVSGAGLRHYDAIDPSGGSVMGMSKNSASAHRDFDFWFKQLEDPNYNYKKGYLFGIPSPQANYERRTFQQNYRMVRYCLMSAA